MSVGPLLRVARDSGWPMAAMLVAWGAASTLWGEVIPRQSGFGWDGTLYRDIALQFPNPIPHISAYTGRRCLPSIAVHYALVLSDRPLDGPHVLAAFSIINCGLFLVMLAALLACGREVGLGARGQWILFAFAFVNYANLKQYYYGPCQTDVWAQAISSLALLCYLKRFPIGIAVATAVGSFAWPAMLPLALPLLLFPRPRVRADHRGMPAHLHTAAAGLIALAGMSAAVHLIYRREFYGGVADEILHPWLPASIALMGGYLFAATRPLLDDAALLNWRTYCNHRTALGLLLVAASIAAVNLLYRPLAPLFPSPYPPATPLDFAKRVIVAAVAKPLVFALAHAVWFGPVIVVAVLLWKSVVRTAREYGLGLVGALGFGVVLGLNSESRGALTFLPIVALLAAKLAEDRIRSNSRLAILFGLGVFLSHAWFPLNRAPWPAEDLLAEFPIQFMFMHVGPYMTTQTYLIQGGIVVAVAAVVRTAVLGSGCAGHTAGDPQRNERDLSHPEPH